MTLVSPAYLTAESLTHVPHGFFGRLGGISESTYGTLNQSFNVGDNARAVHENRRRAAALLHLKYAVTFVRQEHKTHVVDVEDIASDAVTADGLTSGRSDRPIGILTADCVPVLLATPDGLQVLALHAGWRGLAQSIVCESILKWCAGLNLMPRDLRAAVGPAIGPCCFEIRGEALTSLSALAPSAVRRHKKVPAQASASLFAIAHAELVRARLFSKNIDVLEVCTRCTSDLYFSYRHVPVTGRQAAIIAPRPLS